jgi:hypothetical protein
MTAFLQFALAVTVERGSGARDGLTYLASFLSFRALSLYTIDPEVTLDDCFSVSRIVRR